MSILAGMVAASLLQASSAPLPVQGWVWTLYDGAAPTVVLAEEVPDTPHLRTTFECVRGSSQARLIHYQSPSSSDGTASLSAGDAQLEVPASVDGQRLTLNLQLGTPLALGLLSTGQLTLSLDEGNTEIGFDRQSLPRLRRFAQLCQG